MLTFEPSSTNLGSHCLQKSTFIVPTPNQCHQVITSPFTPIIFSIQPAPPFITLIVNPAHCHLPLFVLFLSCHIGPSFPARHSCIKSAIIDACPHPSPCLPVGHSPRAFITSTCNCCKQPHLHPKSPSYTPLQQYPMRSLNFLFFFVTVPSFSSCLF